MLNPLVSIIIPTYNRGHLLRQTLESVLNQTYRNWECIIIDDGSTDNTKDIIKHFKDPRIKYVFKDHNGRSAARNLGLSRAKGDFIQFLDSDDILMETRLEKCVVNLELEKKNIILTNFRCFYELESDSVPAYSELNIQLLTYKKILFNWNFDFTIPIHCGFFDRHLLLNFTFPEHLSEWEDWFLWLHVFQQKDIKTCFLDEVLALCRIRKNSNEPVDAKANLPESKVLETLRGRISELDRAEYFLYLIRKKNAYIGELNNSIKNYKKTRTFKISARIKKLLGLQYNS